MALQIGPDLVQTRNMLSHCWAWYLRTTGPMMVGTEAQAIRQLNGFCKFFNKSLIRLTANGSQASAVHLLSPHHFVIRFQFHVYSTSLHHDLDSCTAGDATTTPCCWFVVTSCKQQIDSQTSVRSSAYELLLFQAQQAADSLPMLPNQACAGHASTALRVS